VAWRSPVPVATAVVRLQDVAPDGTACQVTAGVLNLTHRNGHEDPAPLPIGEPLEVAVRMRTCGYRFEPGHRIRVSVSSAVWPVLWPSPEPATFELLTGPAAPSPPRLILAIVLDGQDTPVPDFRVDPPDLDAIGGGSDDDPIWRVTEDVIAGTVTVESFEGGESVTEDGTRLYGSEHHWMTAADARPAEATMTSEVRYRLEQDGHVVTSDADAEMSSTATEFRLRGELRVTLDGEPFASRRWDETIPRRLV
jgi:hypothetical protein